MAYMGVGFSVDLNVDLGGVLASVTESKDLTSLDQISYDTMM